MSIKTKYRQGNIMMFSWILYIFFMVLLVGCAVLGEGKEAKTRL